MLRELRTNCAEAPAANFSANVAMVTGMAVVKDYATDEVKLPSAATATDLHFVQKARIPTGIYASLVDFSDYEDMFNEVAADEKVVAYTFGLGDAFATDQFDATSLIASNAGKYVMAGTDGKLKVATGSTSAVTSKYKFTGLISDCGHTLARIEVVDAGKNA